MCRYVIKINNQKKFDREKMSVSLTKKYAKRQFIAKNDERNNQLINLDAYSDQKQEKMMGYIPLVEVEQLSKDDKKLAKFRKKKKKQKVIEHLLFFPIETPKQKLYRPSAREGSTLVRFQNKGILFGGFTGNQKMNDVWTLNTSKWFWQPIVQQPEEAPKSGRYGHTANIYQNNKMVVFGGQRKNFLGSKGYRENFNDIWIMNLLTYEWKHVMTQNFIEQRKNHAAVLFQDRLVVYGGIDKYNQYLSEVQEFNLTLNRWQLVEIECHKNVTSLGIQGHRIAAVFENTKIFNRLTQKAEYYRNKTFIN